MHDYAYMVKRNHRRRRSRWSPATRARSTSTLAMERGEIDGACGWDWSSAKAQKPDWIRDGKLNLLAQIGLDDERGTDQARACRRSWHYMKDDDARKVDGADRQPAGVPAALFHGRWARRTIVWRSCARRSTPPCRMRSSWPTPRRCASTFRRLPGAKVQELVQKLYATPKDIVEHAGGDQAIVLAYRGSGTRRHLRPRDAGPQQAIT